MSEGPFKDTLNKLPSQGVFQHTLTSYKYKNGQLVKETHSRVYQKDGDYIDSFTSLPIGEGSSV